MLIGGNKLSELGYVYNNSQKILDYNYMNNLT